MAAFDTALTPVSVAPANTSNASLDPDNNSDASVLVNVANIGTGAIAVRVGITPSGGSVFWIVYDLTIGVGDGAQVPGPLILQAGDVITVRTNTANDAVFSLTGVESS